jgi:hypothetical protein
MFSRNAIGEFQNPRPSADPLPIGGFFMNNEAACY